MVFDERFGGRVIVGDKHEGAVTKGARGEAIVDRDYATVVDVFPSLDGADCLFARKAEPCR